MEQENQNNIDYLIKPGETYRLIRNDFKKKIFYKIEVEAEKTDGTPLKGFKNVSFDKKVEFKDGTLITIKKAHESFFYKKGDIYNPMFTLVITDFDYVQPNSTRLMNANEDFDDF